MARQPQPPERRVEILFEGDLDARPRADPSGDGPADDRLDPHSHDVGVDRLGAAVAAVTDSVNEARSRRAETSMLGAAGHGDRFSDLLPERSAQVVQATQVPAREVIALLRSGQVTLADRLELRPEPLRSADRVAVFDGHLRLRRPPTRRRVELRVYPTASGNLAVLEMLPRRVWMPQTRRYLAAGVPAMTALTDLLEAAARSQGLGG